MDRKHRRGILAPAPWTDNSVVSGMFPTSTHNEFGVWEQGRGPVHGLAQDIFRQLQQTARCCRIRDRVFNPAPVRRARFPGRTNLEQAMKQGLRKLTFRRKHVGGAPAFSRGTD